MTLSLVALFALVPVAATAWRWSRPIAVVVGALFVSTCGYGLLAWRFPEAHAAGRFEAQRWMSAVVGGVGALELGRAAKEASSLRALGRRGWLGLLALASMAGVGAAHVAERLTGEWVLPVAQILVCAVMVAVAVWPQRRTS